MSSLLDRIHELINDHEDDYYDNEGQIAVYMAKRWPDAFSHTAASFGDAFDIANPPSTQSAADSGIEHISNPDEFFDAFASCVHHVADGGDIRDGEFC